MHIIKKTKTLISIFLFILLISCTEVKTDESWDFTEAGLFTGGIEGPAVDKKGTLYAVNFGKEGTIGKVDAQGQASLYANLPEGSTGNGIRFDRMGQMFVADYTGHQVLLKRPEAKEFEVFAQSDALNQPNDLAIAPNGLLFASDPNWQEGTGQLWRVEEGAFILLEKNMGTTNGIEVSPGGDLLYVNESVQRRIWVYDLNSSGEISNKRLFYSFKDHGMDGMRCDAQGNLYVCRYDAGLVVVLSPGGKILREVKLKGKKPSNIAFGGEDGKTCFVTLQDRGAFETFQAEHPGRSFVER